MIEYTYNKEFTMNQIQDLFLSVGWVSGNHPTKLYQALMNYPTVLTAWDEEKLVGLVGLLDDGVMTAYMNYVLVSPDYHGRGIAGHMIEMIKEKYKDYFYIEIMPEEKENAKFYEKHGFSVLEDGVAMHICNPNFD